jgi:hypothetical protein
MTGREVLRTVTEMRSEKDRFVKWWRKEEDFLDYDLLDRFVNNSKEGEEIGGIELLTMDDMWNEVKRIGGARVKLVHDNRGDRVEWLHKGRSGIHTELCDYTPETLMAIYDVETGGNPVDS